MSTTHQTRHIESLVTDFENLYLDPTFSDVKLCVGDNRFDAHRAVLAARSGYFRTLLLERGSECKEIEIECKDEEAFRLIFKYMYTGDMALESLSDMLIFTVLELARCYGLPNLTKSVMDLVISKLSTKILIKALTSAVTLNLDTLFVNCLQYADVNAEEVLNAEDFPSLPVSILIQLISRDSLCIEEMDLFLAVQRWIKSNSDKDSIHSSNLSINSSISTCSTVNANEIVEEAASESETFSLKGHASNGCTLNLDDQMKIMSCIRYSLITVRHLIHTVRPSALVSDQMIFDAIDDQVVSLTALPYRAVMLEDIQRPEFKVTRCENPDQLVCNTYNDKNEITHNHDANLESSKMDKTSEWVQIEFERLYAINNINVTFFDVIESQSYSYCIKVSRDRESWEKIIDYSKYLCGGMQELYFECKVVKFIRIIDKTRKGISLKSFRARFSKDTVAFDPKTNVVIPSKSISLNDYLPLYNGDCASNTAARLNSDGQNEYVSVGSGAVILNFRQPFLVDRCSVMIKDFDCDSNRYYKEDRIKIEESSSYGYTIKGSTDSINWTVLVDTVDKGFKPWTIIKFSQPTVCSFIELSCYRRSELGLKSPFFHFKCPE